MSGASPAWAMVDSLVVWSSQEVPMTSMVRLGYISWNSSAHSVILSR